MRLEALWCLVLARLCFLTTSISRRGCGCRGRALVTRLRPVCVHLEKTSTETCWNWTLSLCVCHCLPLSLCLSPPSPKCLPDLLVSVTGPFPVSSPLWWMATFPLFIASLNHALMLLWPIFAALLYFSPLFFKYNFSNRSRFHFPLARCSSRYNNLWRFITTLVFRRRFLRSGSVAETDWDTFGACGGLKGHSSHIQFETANVFQKIEAV